MDLRERLNSAMGDAGSPTVAPVSSPAQETAVDSSASAISQEELSELFGDRISDTTSSEEGSQPVADGATPISEDTAQIIDDMLLRFEISGASDSGSGTYTTGVDVIDDPPEPYFEEEEVEEEEEDDFPDEEGPGDSVVEPVSEPIPTLSTRRSRRMESSQPSSVSGSRIIQEATSRFSGALWYDKIRERIVTIVGVGGIGSWTALLISRLGVRRIVLYDDDIVELGNISGQLYSSRHIDMNKVDALSRELADYSLFSQVTAIPSRFTSSDQLSPVTIACLDSMRARRTTFERWVEAVQSGAFPGDYLFIDGRLSAEVLQVYAVAGDNPYDINKYRETLFDDNEADSEICSYKQTSFMANMIASLITNVFVNYVASKIDGGAAREIPFKTEYLGEMMWFKSEI